MDLRELDRFVDIHMTAAALMVPIAPPLPATMRLVEAKQELARNEFDLALVEDERLQIVTAKRMKQVNREELARPVAEFVESPRRDRLIEATLPIRTVVGKLMHGSDPLLVVGDSGVTHIITVADFAGVAGTAVVLSFLLALDRGLNELLATRADEAWNAVTDKQREDAEKWHRQAASEDAALPPLDYLSMGGRFTALQKLGMHQQFGLGTKEEHRMLKKTRDEAAHRGLGNPDAALQAVATAEWMLRRLSEL